MSRGDASSGWECGIFRTSNIRYFVLKRSYENNTVCIDNMAVLNVNHVPSSYS